MKKRFISFRKPPLIDYSAAMRFDYENNQPVDLPAKKSRGRGVIARLTSRKYLGNEYNLLIPAIKPIPPPPPINAFPGRFKMKANIR